MKQDLNLAPCVKFKVFQITPETLKSPGETTSACRHSKGFLKMTLIAQNVIAIIDTCDDMSFKSFCRAKETNREETAYIKREMSCQYFIQQEINVQTIFKNLKFRHQVNK